MPLPLPPPFMSIAETNLVETSAAGRAGTNVDPGLTINTKGAWTSLVDPTDNPSYGIWVAVTGISLAAAVRNYLLDIGYGPTGGGTEQVLIPNLDCGGAIANGWDGPQKTFYFPVYIPTGVRVSGRAQSNVASLVGEITVWLCQNSLFPFSAGPVSDYGTTLTASTGTSVTPALNAWGTWTQISASTARPHRFWACAVDALADTTIANADALIELGIGPDALNVTRIFGPSRFQFQDGEVISTPTPNLFYAPVPASSILWCRMAGGDEARGVIAYGVD